MFRVTGGSCDNFPAYIMLDVVGFQVSNMIDRFLFSLMSDSCLLYLVLIFSPVSLSLASALSTFKFKTTPPTNALT